MIYGTHPFMVSPCITLPAAAIIEELISTPLNVMGSSYAFALFASSKGKHLYSPQKNGLELRFCFLSLIKVTSRTRVMTQSQRQASLLPSEKWARATLLLSFLDQSDIQNTCNDAITEASISTPLGKMGTSDTLLSFLDQSDIQNTCNDAITEASISTPLRKMGSSYAFALFP
ncbi:hypothetical protein J6590_000297 [Homalodisca vitripennis]|nr:hypothetical protein J6590_000297 [Homalodisca vitripennis]